MRRASTAVICHLPYTHKKTARRAAPLCARACTGATFDVSFRVHSSSSLPSRGCEYPSMSSFRVRVQWVRRTRTWSRVRVHRPRRTRTRQLKLACCPDHGRACFSTRRRPAPSAYATGMAAIRRCAAVQSANRNNRVSACRYSQEYLNHITFAPPEEVTLMAPDGLFGASKRAAE